MITLRPFQRKAVDSVAPALSKVDATLIVAGVAAGKSFIQAAAFQEFRRDYASLRMLSLVHSRELVAQNFQAMLRIWPSAPASINSAALGQRNTSSPIIFASIQSVYKDAAKIGYVDLLFIDEAHLIPRKTNTMYQAFIADLKVINPDLKIVGMSGTAFRLDSGLLHKGPDALFKSICFEIGISELVDLGYLVPATSKATAAEFDVSGVHKRGGEYILGELQAAVNVDTVTEAIVQEISTLAADRKAWMIFCSGVQHAYAMRDAVRRIGVSCETVEGSMPNAERSRNIEAFRSGQIRCVTNCNVLTTGFNYPAVDMIALCRPTMSPGLYIQQVGRGLRLHPGKKNLLVLDFANVVQTHGPVDAVRVKEPGATGGPAPVKTCPECKSILHASARTCPDCGFEFPAFDPDAKLQETASTAAVMSREVRPEWLAVQGWRLVRHENAAKGDSVRAEYRCGLQVHKEWVRFDVIPSGRTRQWWAAHGGGECPRSVMDALKRAGELRAPSEILVRRAGKYFEVASRRFVREEERAA